jgi:hypothetical protein
MLLEKQTINSDLKLEAPNILPTDEKKDSAETFLLKYIVKNRFQLNREHIRHFQQPQIQLFLVICTFF